MDTKNFYKTPESNLEANNSFSLEGNLIKVRSPVYLPNVCIRCAGTTDLTQTSTRLNYVNPLIFFWILLSPIALIVAYFLCRKPADVTFSLCPVCSKKSGKWAFIARVSWIVFVLAILIRIIIGKQFMAIQLCVIITSFFLALIASAMKDTQLSVSKFNDPFFYIKGVGKSCLEKLRGM